MAMPVGLERQPSAALTLATQWSNQSNRSMRSEPRSPVATKESTPFTWSECHNLIPTDAAGVLVRQPPASSAAGVSGLKVSGRLQLPCNHLYHISLYRRHPGCRHIYLPHCCTAGLCTQTANPCLQAETQFYVSR